MFKHFIKKKCTNSRANQEKKKQTISKCKKTDQLLTKCRCKLARFWILHMLTYCMLPSTIKYHL